MSLSRIQLALIVSLCVGVFSNINDIQQQFAKYTRTTNSSAPAAYASQLPQLNSSFSEHVDFLEDQYQDCQLGLNYLNTIKEQNKKMPYENAIEIALMVNQMCKEDD